MKLIKLFLILSILAVASLIKVTPSKKRRSGKEVGPKGKCKDYCEMIQGELSYHLDGDKVSFDGKEGGELRCFGKKDKEEHVIYPMPGKKVTITITSAPKIGFWQCEMK